MRSRRPHPHTASLRGFTLVEVLVATGVASLVLGVLVTLLHLIAAAAPTHASPGPQAIRATHGLDELAADLARATAILRLSPTELELLLPDLSGDRHVDRVHYHWSGQPGAPLHRAYATDPRAEYGPPRTLSPAVAELAFIPDTVVQAPPATSSRGSEVLLGGHTHTAGTLAEELTSQRTFAQTFTPTVPPGATQFTLTRVRLRLQRSAMSEGYFALSLTPASGNVPSGAALLSQNVAATDLPRTLDWVDFTFVGAPTLPATATYAITLVPMNSDSPAVVQWLPSGAASAGKAALSSDGGTSWTPTTGALLFEAFGRHNAAASTAESTVPRARLEGLTIHLTPSASGAGLVSQYFRTLNQPEVP